MSQTLNAAIAVVGIDIGENSFHLVGHDERGAIVLRECLLCLNLPHQMIFWNRVAKNKL